MNLLKQLKGASWFSILAFYAVILCGTYFARRQTNLLQLLLRQISDIPFSFNYNHGIVTLLASLLFYRLSRKKQQITLWGNAPVKSLLFPLVLFSCYTTAGISNRHGINPQLWALIFCALAFLYNIMEEYAWRGYLLERMAQTNYVVKSIVSAVLWSAWHLLVFNNFDQYGGFAVFFVFCLAFSFLLTFAVLRTQAIVVAASLHTFIIQTNSTALVCLLIFLLLLLGWNHLPYKSLNNGQRNRT
ncbi:MAG: CPBP family intramembrane metalloprotease [Chitinophagaceae bacterium]|nr:CPBP family intramembrane metalloprotease [Chitinophagaceae bacterium]